MNLRQDQWDWIFSYAFTLILSAICAWAMWRLNVSPWLALWLAHWNGYSWSRPFPK